MVGNLPAVSEPLRVGLLQLGYIHPDVAATEGDYPEAFAALLAGHDIELTTYDVPAGQRPKSPRDHDGWLASGSANSAYEPLAWIGDTGRFLLEVVDADVPLVAICFGHQLLAQAMGGTVARADVGWGVGVHHYDVVGPARPWMAGPVSELRVIASHQDQVVEAPDGIELLATSTHCRVAGYTVGSRALALQAHPEFTPAVSRGLLDLRRGAIGEARTDAALATLDEPIDQDLIAGWMASFWRR